MPPSPNSLGGCCNTMSRTSSLRNLMALALFLYRCFWYSSVVKGKTSAWSWLLAVTVKIWGPSHLYDRALCNLEQMTADAGCCNTMSRTSSVQKLMYRSVVKGKTSAWLWLLAVTVKILGPYTLSLRLYVSPLRVLLPPLPSHSSRASFADLVLTESTPPRPTATAAAVVAAAAAARA